MGAYIITNNELVAIANAIRQKLSSSDTYFLSNMPAAIASIGTETGSGATIVEGNETKYLVNETKIKAIADAIRAKNGESTKYLLNQLPQAILDIETSPPVEIAEISDSWDQIIANIDNGTYSTRYKIGNYKPLDLGTEGIINMQIVAIDGDELTNGGYAPLTFVGMKLLNIQRPYGYIDNVDYSWENSSLRNKLETEVYNEIPSVVRNRLNKVKKYQYDYDITTGIKRVTTTNDLLFIPSVKEIGFIDRVPKPDMDVSIAYTKIFKKNDDRIRINSSTGKNFYFLRDYSFDGSMNQTTINGISTTGTLSNFSKNSTSAGTLLGFCLGLASQST